MNNIDIINIFKNYDEIKKIKKDVVIYGTGTLARDVYKFMINKGYNIKFFLNKSFNYINVVSDLGEIKKLDDNSITSYNKKNITVCIAAFTAYADIGRIRRDLLDFGYENIVTYAELIDLFDGEIKGKFYLNSRKEFLKYEEYIIKVYDLFKDKKSQELYRSIVKFRLSKNYNTLMQKDLLEEQYFAKDIENLYGLKEIRFIDCGAFDGDTIEQVYNNFDKVEAYVAFEPNLKNYKRLLRRIEKIQLNKVIKNFLAIPCAVYSSATQLRFNVDSDAGSTISNDGTEYVQCISIDEGIRNFNPTFIKMDIEGAEYEALLGTKSTIEKWKPNLAISLYHTPEDIYRIPLLLESWNLNYKYYLRMYGYSGYDLVLYAVM
ncbi:hypothetical protein UT300005_09640 [Clostridium sp. CTA-5]